MRCFRKSVRVWNSLLPSPSFSKTLESNLHPVFCFMALRYRKDLIAKAIASQAKATFIRMSGSDLVQKFVGEGSRLVKDIFQLARDKSPSILFIDEIDAVGSMRTYDGTSGSAEVNRTMLQLLAEMDGFDPKGNVKVVAATNRIDLLDPALLRQAGLTGRLKFHSLMIRQD